METMSDVETHYNSEDLKMQCHCGNRGLSDVGTILNVKFLSQEICVCYSWMPIMRAVAS